MIAAGKHIRNIIEIVLTGNICKPIYTPPGEAIACVVCYMLLYLLFFEFPLRWTIKKSIKKRVVKKIPYYSNSFFKKIFYIGMNGYVPKTTIIINAINLCSCTQVVGYCLYGLIFSDQLGFQLMTIVMAYGITFFVFTTIISEIVFKRHIRKKRK